MSFALLLSVCALVLFLSACSSVGSKLLGKRYVQISQAQLLEKMADFKPGQLEWMRRLNIELSAPRVDMNSEDNRIQAEWDLEMKEGLLTKIFEQKAFKQTIGLSTKLAYAPESRSIVLRGVKLEGDVGANMLGKRFSGEYEALINQFVNVAIEQGLENYPVFQFKPDQLHRMGIDWEVDDIIVQDGGLSVGIQPEKR